MKYSVGDLVVSLCGHDKGDLLIVIDADEIFVTVCDGKTRKADKKKKKKIKHIKSTGLHSDLVNNVPHYAVDANIRREIKRLREFL